MRQFYRIQKKKHAVLTAILAAFCALLLPVNAQAQAPGFAWAKQGHGQVQGTSTDLGLSVGTDAQGNSYVTGEFEEGSITFGTTVLTSAQSGSQHGSLFLVKYDSAGNVVWARQTLGQLRTAPYDIAVDAAGNSYVTGTTQGETTFGTVITGSAAMHFDVFVAKYNPNGDLVWVTRTGGNQSEAGTSIAIDQNGNSYVTGAFSGTTAVFGNSTLTGNGNSEMFVAKFDALGNPLWARSGGGSHANEVPSDAGTGITVGPSGNAYVTGVFRDAATFGTTTLVSSGKTDVFIAKYDTNGTLLLIKKRRRARGRLCRRNCFGRCR